MGRAHRFGTAFTMGVLGALPAMAAEPPLEPLEEIVVTATRRQQTLADVPASVSALSEEQILQRGARSIADYVLSIPGVSFTNAGEEIGADFTLRGVSSLSGAATTTTYVDETPLPSDIRLFDVERVEVLRGPQGTLFGASTMGGAIRTITRKPDTTGVAGTAELSLAATRHADGPDSSANAALNLPVVEGKLGFRASVYRDESQGLVKAFRAVLDNTTRQVSPTPQVLADAAGGRVVSGGRAALRLEADETLSVTLTGYHQKDKADGFGTTDADIYGGKWSQARALRESTRDRFSLGNLLVEKDLGFANLVSSTSYSGSRNANETDGTRVLSRLAFALNGIPGVGGFIRSTVDGVPITNDGTTKVFTQEARLASKGSGWLSWLGGAYFSRERGDYTQRIRLTPTSSSSLPGAEIFKAQQESTAKELSVFGEVSAEVADGLKVTLGTRRYWLDTEQTTRRGGPLATAQGQSPVVGPLDASEDGGTYKANLSYDAGQLGLFYVQAASGYRPGGANSPNPLGGIDGEPVTPASYTSDTLWQYEAGVRTGFLDGKVILNLAAYYTDWKKIQSVQSTPTGFNYVGNFGDAHTKGLEAELAARLAPGLTVGGTATFTVARYDSDIPDEGVETGDPIPDIPRHGFSAYAQYEAALTDAVDGYARLDLSQVGARRAKPGDSPELQSYAVLNARLGVTWNGLDLSAYANNLTDEKRVVGARPLGSNLRLTYLRPRSLGLRLRADF